jgi:uncharacterized protein (TIRG00374 family)
MKKKWLQIAGSVIVAALFLWLAFRSIDLAALWNQIGQISYGWILLFIPTLLLSHYLRAERWRLLLPQKNSDAYRSTLFAGVMLGYVMNNIIPRIGELSRPVYVAKKEAISTGNLLGTIVVERLFDLFVLGLLTVFSIFLFAGNPVVIENLFGVTTWSWIHYSIIPALFLLAALAIWIFHIGVIYLDEKGNIKNQLLSKVIERIRSFSEGVTSLKKVKNWPLFILLTAGIWFGYVLMTYIPLYMLDLHSIYGITVADAVVLTVVSSIGVSIPTPAGIGSYHLLMQQALHILFDVDLVTALTFATVLHAANVLVIFTTGPLILWWDKYYTLRNFRER